MRLCIATADDENALGTILEFSKFHGGIGAHHRLGGVSLTSAGVFEFEMEQIMNTLDKPKLLDDREPAAGQCENAGQVNLQPIRAALENIAATRQMAPAGEPGNLPESEPAYTGGDTARDLIKSMQPIGAAGCVHLASAMIQEIAKRIEAERNADRCAAEEARKERELCLNENRKLRDCIGHFLESLRSALEGDRGGEH